MVEIESTQTTDNTPYRFSFMKAEENMLYRIPARIKFLALSKVTFHRRNDIRKNRMTVIFLQGEMNDFIQMFSTRIYTIASGKKGLFF